MKKWIVWILALALVLSMAGCGNSAEKPAEDTAESAAPNDIVPEEAEKSEAPETEETAENAEEAPAEEQEEPAEEPAEEPVEESEEPAEEPETAQTEGPDLSAISELLKAAGMPEMILLDSHMMLDYCGIEEADVNQAVVLICADSLRTDEIWLIEAVDEDAAQRIVGLAETRLQMKAEESESYSPEQYAVVQDAQLLQEGNYVALLVSPEVAALTALYEQLIAQ